MFWEFLFDGRQTRERRRGIARSRRRSRTIHFEPLEARRMLAADFGWQAAGSSISVDAQAVPAMLAQQAGTVETPAALDYSASDGASQLLGDAAALPPSDVIDTLRSVKDIDAIRDGNGAAGLPEPGDQDADPRSMAFDLLGDGSTNPGLPGASQGDDRGQMLDAMLSTFRGGSSQGAPWSSPDEPSSSRSQDPHRDPFARVGWVHDGPIHIHGGAYVDENGDYHTHGFTRLNDRWIFTHDIYHTDGTTTTEVRTIHDSGDIECTAATDGADGEPISRTEVFDGDVILLEPVVIEVKVPDDHQPNPADDSRGLTFINPDPWALFLAWYTGQTGSPLKDPYDDEPGSDPSETGYGSPSAAPRVGLEAVINPVDPLWGSRPGGGGRDPSDGPIGPPEM